MKILTRDFYQRDTLIVAQELIGKILIRKISGKILSGRIVETEAYRSDDPACHAYRGKTERTKALFGIPGHTYVYFTYGCHYCLNVVARDEQMPAGGVLLRALEPLQGIEIMQLNRNKKNLLEISNGPGKITQALQITKKEYGIDVTTNTNNLYILDAASVKVHATPRIGISVAQDLLWRFCDTASPFVSKKNHTQNQIGVLYETNSISSDLSFYGIGNGAKTSCNVTT